MGAATSKNVAKSVSDVSNSISNSTTADASQANDNLNRVTLDNCRITAVDDVLINMVNESKQVSKQIVAAKNDTSLDNNIQQKMLQEASSTVGSMGVGFASATNNASMFSNISNEVKNSIGATAQQWSQGTNDFFCKDSIIKGRNTTINLTGKNSAYNDQTVSSLSTTDIVNSVSQSIDQKATAKVEGLAAFFVALALMIGAIGYTLSKPLSTGPFKMVMGAIICIILIVLIVFMYIRKTPPFFSDDNECSFSNPTIGGCEADCIKYKEKTFTVKQAPLRYSLKLFNGIQSNGMIENSNLLQTVISSKKTGNNGGYNLLTMKNLVKQENSVWDLLKEHAPQGMGDTNKPPPLLINPHDDPLEEGWKIPKEFLPVKGTCTPQIVQHPKESNQCSDFAFNDYKLTKFGPEYFVANFNKEEWSTYLENYPSYHAFIRFYLWKLSGMEIDLSIYIDDDELVEFRNLKNNQIEIRKASDVNQDKDGHIFKMIPSSTNYQQQNGMNGGGKITGKVGVCNDNTYKFHKFMRNIGSWIILITILIALVYVMKPKKNKEYSNSTNKTK